MTQRAKSDRIITLDNLLELRALDHPHKPEFERCNGGWMVSTSVGACWASTVAEAIDNAADQMRSTYAAFLRGRAPVGQFSAGYLRRR